VLSIAGSDSGGGAGIQADLKAFAACGVHGMTAITAITAQNTVGVSAVAAISPEIIVAQVTAVAQDIGVDAVKIGMLGTAETIDAVARALEALDALGPADRPIPVVIDPVMVSESGAELLSAGARVALAGRLLPRATVVTPNLAEARVLAGIGPDTGTDTDTGTGTDTDDAEALARAIHRLGPDVVIVTGGHRAQASDLLFDGTQVLAIDGPRHPDGAAHGSGCTHSSVLAARLAYGDPPFQAARVARAMAAEAVRRGLRGVGAGPGPVNVLAVT
jgi:hydroxymethylpyrimidine/phosphomethylpyrimidine kinase